MHTIGIRGTQKTFIIEDMTYPFVETDMITGMPVPLVRMVVVDEEEKRTHFLVAKPPDIVYRTYPFTQEIMDDILEAAEQAEAMYEEARKLEVVQDEPLDDNHSNYHG